MASNFITDAVDFVFGKDSTVSDQSNVSTSDQTGTVDTKTNTQQDQKSASQTGSVQATDSTATTNQNSTTQTLSDSQLQAGSAVLQQLSSDFSPADLSALSQRISGADDDSSAALKQVYDRALGAEDSLNSGNAAIIAQQEATGEKNRDAKAAQSAGAAGSAFNTLTQKTFASADNDLQVSMAALGAQLQSTNRQQATAELLSAVDAMQKQSGVISTSEGAIPALEAQINASSSAAVSNLLNALKGGLTTSSSSATTDTSSRTENQSTTNANSNTVTQSDENKGVDLNTNTVTVGKNSTTNPTGILDILKALD